MSVKILHQTCNAYGGEYFHGTTDIYGKTLNINV